METQCQHLKVIQHNILLNLLHKFGEFLYGKIGTWKTYPVDFELKEDVKPICSRPYLVPKLHK